MTLDEATSLLRAAEIESPRREARLLQDLAQSSSTALAGEGDHRAAMVEGAFAQYVARRAAHEPFAYISGHREFYGLDFRVGPGCLIPRPDTETLIETALRHRPDRTAKLSILDLGTGSGCLLATLLTLYPNAHGVGIDSAPDALRWARENVAAFHLEDRATLIETEWPEEASPGFDLIVSNPPYIPSAEIETLAPEVRDFEPSAALDGGPDGLAAYRVLIPRVVRLLAPTGLALFEIGRGQCDAVSTIVSETGLKLLEINHDLAGIPRCVLLAQGERNCEKRVGS